MHNNGWQRALDLQMDQLKWHQTEFATNLTRSFFEVVLEKHTNAATPIGAIVNDVNTLTNNVSETLWRGDTMYITEDMEHLILQAADDLPDDYRWDMHTLLCPVGFCLLEEPLFGADIHGRNLSISAISWCMMRHGGGEEKVLVIHFWTSTDESMDEVNQILIPDMRECGFPIGPFMLAHYYMLGDGGIIRPGKDHDHPQGTELVDSTLGLFAAMNILAGQTIGTPIKIPPDRASRKRYQRDFTNAPERMITLITLRRKSAQKHDPDAPPVPWSRRWVVTGHWRKQPDKNGWHWVYIYEYIKGPEDKPLIIRERRVFNFRR